MGIMYIMLIASLVLAIFFLLAFFWAVKNGQYTDDETPAIRMLFDDETNLKTKTKTDGSREV